MGFFGNLFRPGGAALTETGIAQALAAQSLTDAQGRSTIASAANVAAGLRAIGLTVVADGPPPQLTLTGPLTYATNAAAGTLVANIGNVPAGVTPTITPNDGRLVVAGNAGAWTVVVGMSASSAGTIALAVAASGATGASASVTVTAAPSAKTTFPTSGAFIYELDPDVVTGVANGARVVSVANAASGITAVPVAAGVGPKMVTNAPNGHKGLLFSNDTTEGLTLGQPAALTDLLSSPFGWSVVITFMGASIAGDSRFVAMFSDEYSGGFYMSAGSASVSTLNGSKRSFSNADPATNVHTLIYSGDPVTNGRRFLDGTMFASIENISHKPGVDFLIGLLRVNGNPFQAFGGTILNLRIVNTSWTPPEALQVHQWACTRYGKALPIAGRSFFPVLDGNSITFDTSTAVNGYYDSSYPAQLAATRGWPMGAFANVGKPSATMAAGSNNGYNLSDL